MFFTELFMIILEGYLEYLISGVYEFKYNGGSLLTNAFMVFIFFMCFVMLCAFVYNVFKNENNQKTMTEIYQTYGSLQQDVDNISRWRTAFYLVYCIRRIVFVYIIFFVNELPGM